MQAIKQKSNVLAPFSFRSPRRNLMPVICFKTIIFHFLSPLSKADIRGRLPIFSLKEVWIHGKPCFSPYRQRQRTSAHCLPLISRKICEITKHPEKGLARSAVSPFLRHIQSCLCGFTVSDCHKNVNKRKIRILCYCPDTWRERQQKEEKSDNRNQREEQSRTDFFFSSFTAFYRYISTTACKYLFNLFDCQAFCSTRRQLKVSPAITSWMDVLFPGSSLNLFLKHIKILWGWISPFFTAHSCSISITLSGNEIHFRALPLMSCRV